MILIDMEMPTECRECYFAQYDINLGRSYCGANDQTLADGFRSIKFEGRHENCPLIELPKGHGRLIDEMNILNPLADKYELQMLYGDETIADWLMIVREIIANAPTVVSADKE